MNKQHRRAYFFNSFVYGIAIFSLLIIEKALELDHVEWGIITATVIFMPSRSKATVKGLERVLGTLVSLIILYVLSTYLLHHRILKLVLITLCFILFNNLNVIVKKYHYAFSVAGITISVFGFPQYIDKSYVLEYQDYLNRLIQVLIGCGCALLAIYIKHFLERESLEEEPEKLSEPSSLKDYYRYLAFSGVLLLMLWIFSSTTMYFFVLVIYGVTTAFSVTELDKKHTGFMILRGILLSFLFASIYHLVDFEEIIPISLHVYGIALFFMLMMYVSFIIKDGFVVKIASVFTPINVLIYDEIGDSPFKMFVVFLCFVVGVLIVLLANRFVLETKRILK